MEKFLFIKTTKGNTYYYSVSDRRILFLHPVVAYLSEKAIEHDPIINSDVYLHFRDSYNKEEIDSYVAYFNRLSETGLFDNEKAHSQCAHFNTNITPEIVQQSLSNCPQLVIEVTEQCSLACQYCIYGDIYSSFSQRSNGTMDKEMAQKMIDFMFSIWLSQDNQSPFDAKYIGFYGGEPLLNIALIKELVLYTENKKRSTDASFPIKFTITTNGLLLSHHIDFLVEHNFEVLISLDGDREDNAARVFKNGNNSFDSVINNITIIKERYPAFFEKNVSFNAVYNKYSDFERIDSFFKSHGLKYRITELNPFFEHAKGNLLYKRMKDNTEPSSFEQFEYSGFSLEDFYSFFTEIHNSYLSFVAPNNNTIIPTGACLPFSRKLFLTVQGLILHCETIPHKHALGHASSKGVTIDLEKCAEYFNSYYKKLIPSCINCYRSQNCKMCFFLHMDDCNDSCPLFMDNIAFKRFLVKFLDYLESHPSIR